MQERHLNNANDAQQVKVHRNILNLDLMVVLVGGRFEVCRNSSLVQQDLLSFYYLLYNYSTNIYEYLCLNH